MIPNLELNVSSKKEARRLLEELKKILPELQKYLLAQKKQRKD